jgi:sortase A
MLVAAVCGAWLLFAPSRERAAVENEQEALMQDILQEINENRHITMEYFCMTLHEPLLYSVDSGTADFAVFTNGGDNEGYELPDIYEQYHQYRHYRHYYEPYEHTPYAEPAPEVIFEPLPQSAFPSAIQGIGILTIERIDLRLPIAEGIEYATLRIAPGRVPQTALVGDIGNAVIAGHRNYAFGSMFNRLGEVEVGDVIGFTALSGEEMTFEVFEISVIEPQDQIAFIQPTNNSIITLYTCTPIRVASHRLLIRAQRV